MEVVVMKEARRFIVSGLVQGVGFRYFVLRRARERDVVGFVRNLPDGRVEVMAEGIRESLDSLREDLHVGPGSAKVARIDEHPETPTGRFPAFTIAG